MKHFRSPMRRHLALSKWILAMLTLHTSMPAKAIDVANIQLEWASPVVSCESSESSDFKCDGFIAHFGRSVESEVQMEVSTSLVASHREAPLYNIVLTWAIDPSGALVLYWPPVDGLMLYSVRSLEMQLWASLVTRSPFFVEPSAFFLEASFFKLGFP
jgi:hypothetical protein